VSEALWIAEGFTQYYGMLLMKRAGFTSDDAFRHQVAGLVRAKEHTPGGRYYTPIESSQMAVFVDAGVAVDRTNYPNIHTSYYTYGAALALALDLQLRQQFGSSMDGFMQELWKRQGKPEKPYTLPDVEKALGAVSTAAFAREFFSRYVYDHQSYPYATLLPAAGWQLKKTAEGKAWLGSSNFKTDNDRVVVNSPTVRNTPLYKAGVDIDDVLLQLDGSELKSSGDIEAVLAKHKPGDKLTLVYSHRGQRKESQVEVGENPAFSLVPMESLTEAQQSFQKNWFGGKAI
jgi:predicted metalloprotease with PDZ domain